MMTKQTGPLHDPNEERRFALMMKVFAALKEGHATRSETMPNGIASGKVKRIVIGCIKDSNCAARTMYIKTNESIKASPK